jgi:pimeloyl-ACP methyl ester carboxylesterase
MHWLFLRGLAREQRHYGSFPEIFERRIGERPFLMDLAGFGTQAHRESPTTIQAITDDLRARFLEERPSDGPWSIFAISLGGMVALDWAARFPGEFRRVVVANTSAGDLSKPWERFSTRLWPRLPGLVAGGSIGRERAILDITCNNPAVDKEALAQKWAAFFDERRPARASFVRQLVAATRSRLADRIELPGSERVHVLTSRADRLVSWRCSERVAQRLGARLDVHDEAGHDLSLDAPEWICDRITS